MCLPLIQSQSITVSKNSPHTYINDSLICLDKTASMRVMADRVDCESKLADYKLALHITDSVAEYRGIQVDTLTKRADYYYELSRLRESDLVWTKITMKKETRFWQGTTIGGIAIGIIIALIKF